jgi:AraC-like DNA-binding protein
MRPLLERLPILRSRDFSQAQAFLSARSIQLDVAGPARNCASFDVRYNGIYLPGMWLGYIEYGAAVTARISPRRGDYWAHFPLQGRLESSMGGHQVECDSRRGVITSPRETHVVRSEAHAARLSISINGEALTGQLAALLDDAPSAPLEFAAGISLETGHGRSLSHALRCAVAELECHDWLRSPLSASQFEQSVMTALLLWQPSNYAQELGAQIHPIAPRDVAHAVDYMHENLAEPITLADLVRESGVAGRTLLKHFHDFKGVSPMRYLRHLRLKRIRDELENGKAARVSESALRWGFPHAGRFSLEYRKRFGEAPSATLARRRNG